MDFKTKRDSFQTQKEKIAFINEQWEYLETHRRQYECKKAPQILGDGWTKKVLS